MPKTKRELDRDIEEVLSERSPVAGREAFHRREEPSQFSKLHKLDDFESTWDRIISAESEGLDFNDAEDRAVFRGRLTEALSNLRIEGMRRLAEALAVGHPGRSRSQCIHSIANAWMRLERARQ